jgi:hypothetical protein
MYNLDAADKDLPLMRCIFPHHSYLGKPSLFCLKNP